MATYNITVQVHTQDEVGLDTAKALLEKSFRPFSPRYRLDTGETREALLTIAEVTRETPAKAKVEETDPVQLFTSFVESIFANK